MNNEEKILGILETLSADMSGVKTEMSGVKADISGMKTEMSGMNIRMDNVELTVAETKENLKDLTQIVAGIETKHGNMLEAILDGMMTHREDIVGLKDDVSQLHSAKSLRAMYVK